MRLSASLEDYLEAILDIGQGERPVRASEIAARLHVSRPSVNEALKNLAAQGLVRHHPYRRIEITASGLAKAREVRRRHDAIHAFLRDVLGVAPAVAEPDACRIEHVLSRETFQKLVDYLVQFGAASCRPGRRRPQDRPRRWRRGVRGGWRSGRPPVRVR